MGRYTGPVEKLSRREGVELFLKGERALNGKSALERRGDNPPGQHGANRRRKQSIYYTQLRAKQTAKRYYGVREKQFRIYVDKANRAQGVTGEELLRLLERRLDNVVYRLGFAGTRAQARQFVNHGHVLVDGGKVDIALRGRDLRGGDGRGARCHPPIVPRTDPRTPEARSCGAARRARRSTPGRLRGCAGPPGAAAHR